MGEKITYENIEMLGGIELSNFHPEGKTFEFKCNGFSLEVCPLYSLAYIVNSNYDRTMVTINDLDQFIFLLKGLFGFSKSIKKT